MFNFNNFIRFLSSLLKIKITTETENKNQLHKTSSMCLTMGTDKTNLC